MENLKLYKQQIREIEALIAKMEKGELSVSELSELEEFTRKLHEKSIILKYKAFERKSRDKMNEQEAPDTFSKVIEPKPKAEEKTVIDFSSFNEETSATKKEDLPIEDKEKSTQKNTEQDSFLDKFAVVDNSLNSKFEGAKINTLVGAVGLNQKLRYINVLFDGSSELYGKAIKALDTQSSLEHARVTLDELAVSNEWDPEEQTVIEFMEMLNRRYA